jgi:hypothetical protein
MDIQGIVIATASHGTTVEGMFWMMVIGRGIAGVGAGTSRSLVPTTFGEC